MKIDRNKVLARAQKFIQRGELEKAAAEYEKLVQAHSSDVNSLVRLAGLYLRLKRERDAVEAYRRAGEQYAKTGFYQKAVAAYKQALQLVPEDPDLLEQLGNLYQQMGLKSSAVEHFVKAAQGLAAHGRYEEAVAAMRTVLELEPDRPDYKARYGEYLFQAGHKEEAVAVFRGLTEILKLEGQWEELARFYERILAMNPDDAELAKDLARTYLRLGLAPKALKRLKELFESGVRDAEIFDLLARAYVLLGKNHKAISAYLEKVKRLNPVKDAEEVQKTYRRILEIDPTNEQALAALGEMEEEQEEELEVLAIDEGLDEGEEPVVEVVAVEEAPGSPSVQVAASGSQDSTLQEMLQEASVYLRYGIHDKALRKLDNALKADPDNILARKKRAEILKRVDPARAVADLVKLAEIYEDLGDIGAAEQAIEEARALDANHPALKAFLGESVETRGAVEAEAVVGGEPEVELDLEAAEVFPDAAEFLESGEVEGEATVLDVEVGEIETEPEVDLEVEPKVEIELETAGVETEAEAVGSGRVPYEEELDQVRFFLETQLYDEARKLLDDLVARYGEQPVFAELQAQLSEAPGAAGVSAATTATEAAPAGGKGFAFDLARELEDELGFLDEQGAGPGAEDVPSFEEIFADFKKGVKEQIGEDADAHYDLGIAYLEMDLVDDAIAEFEQARQDPRRAADAWNMIALAHTRKGDLEAAAEAYRRGLEEAQRDPAVELNMHYELAQVLEELGDFRGALEHYKEVLKRDKNYREVVGRLKAMRERLSSAKGEAGSNVTYL